MTVRRLVCLVVMLVALGIVVASSSAAENKYRLKPGAAGKLCFECHDDFKAKLNARHVHTPVKTGDCAGCHNPHTSKHGKLLSEAPSGICASCHADIVPAKAVSHHKVVLEGNCVKCHDPHASGNKAQLVKAGNELCVGCHKTVGDTVAKVKFRHAPVATNCLSCHNPHGSDTARHLLTKRVPALCLECHNPGTASFARQHVNYPVAKADCTSCHDVHGSNTAGILFDSVHPPVAAKRCSQCHNPATADDAFATRRAGFELCRGCHAGTVNDAFSKNRVHWPVVDKTGCLNCHEAHASRQKKLLNVPEAVLCGKCHSDTLAYQAQLAEQDIRETPTTKGRVVKGSLTHSPVQSGECSTCHSPHAANDPRLLVRAQSVEMCGACHDWATHTAHPMGEKVSDPRNKNRSIDCLSCHRSHGTGYRYLLSHPSSTDLCVQCHRQLRK